MNIREVCKNAIRDVLRSAVFLERLFGYYVGVTFDHCENCGCLFIKRVDGTVDVKGLIGPLGLLIGYPEIDAKCPYCNTTLQEKTFDLDVVLETIDEVVEEELDYSPFDSVIDFDIFIDLLKDAYERLFEKLLEKVPPEHS